MAVVLLQDELLPTFVCQEGEKHREYSDSLLTGLYLDALQSGHQSYRVRYILHGKRSIITLGDVQTVTLKEARQQAREILRKVARNLDPKVKIADPLNPRFANFFKESYLPFVRSYKRSWGVDDAVFRHHLQPVLGELPLNEVTTADILKVVKNMQEQNLAPATINRAIIILHYAFKLALKWHLTGLNENPVTGVKLFKEDNKIEHYLTEEQKNNLLQITKQSKNPLLYEIVCFLLLTGARKREVLDAKWEDVNLSKGLWRIPKTKSGKIRHIPLSKTALGLLDQLKEKVGSSGYLFPNPQTGKPFNSFYYSWHKARTQAGLKHLRVHDLRHSFASFLVNSGRSLYEVQELLGHASITTTTRYAHLNLDRLRDAVESVSIAMP